MAVFARTFAAVVYLVGSPLVVAIDARTGRQASRVPPSTPLPISVQGSNCLAQKVTSLSGPITVGAWLRAAANLAR